MTNKQKKILTIMKQAISYGFIFLLTVLILCVGTRICDKVWNETELDIAMYTVTGIIVLAGLRVILRKVFLWWNKKKAIEAMKIMVEEMVKKGPVRKVDDLFGTIDTEETRTKERHIIEVID